MARKNKITIRSGTGVPSASDFVANEPAWDGSAGKLYIKNAAGTMTPVGNTVVMEYASPASFPSTGASQTVYVATDSGRIYRWSGSVYYEIGARLPASLAASYLFH